MGRKMRKRKKEKQNSEFKPKSNMIHITQNLQQVFGSIVVFHKISRIFG